MFNKSKSYLKSRDDISTIYHDIFFIYQILFDKYKHGIDNTLVWSGMNVEQRTYLLCLSMTMYVYGQHSHNGLCLK